MVGSVMKLLIFSLDTKERQPGSEEYNTILNHLLTGEIEVNAAENVNNGQTQAAFMCLVETDLQEKMVLGIAHAYKQSSLLEIDLPSRAGHVRFISGAPRKYLGLWVEAGPGVTGDFTLNKATMKVLHCVPDDKTG